MKIYLASRSPRRRQLLEQVGIEFETVDVDIDERWDGRESPKNYVRRMALEKARAGKAMINHDACVLAADTAVVLDNEVLGKAVNQDDAMQMLTQLSGRTHEVMSAVAVINNGEHCLLNISKVSFMPLTDDQIRKYCETGEPEDKAGGYAIQGRAAAFIAKLEGSYSGVMGLPLYETWKLLGNYGR